MSKLGPMTAAARRSSAHSVESVERLVMTGSSAHGGASAQWTTRSAPDFLLRRYIDGTRPRLRGPTSHLTDRRTSGTALAAEAQPPGR